LNADDFYVDDRSGIDINTLRARVMDFNRRCGLAAVGVDYMQIVRGCERVGDRRQEVGEVAQGLKQLAKDINVPVIALAQMSRGD
jgi:replicative DNA helicase